VKFVATVGDAIETVDITGDSGRYRVAIGDRVWEVDGRRIADTTFSLVIDGASHLVDVATEGSARVVHLHGLSFVMDVEEEVRHRLRGGAAGAGARGTVRAPLPGRITHVAVKPGDAVQPGDTLLVIEAMKMENEFKAGAAGTVREVRVEPGQPVNAGDVLVVID
jgi:propionyl-CoA carboxylase alpha chain